MIINAYKCFSLLSYPVPGFRVIFAFSFIKLCTIDKKHGKIISLDIQPHYAEYALCANDGELLQDEVWRDEERKYKVKAVGSSRYHYRPSL